jgi:hypothetical protein
VKAIVRKKLVFSDRPRPIIANVAKTVWWEIPNLMDSLSNTSKLSHPTRIKGVKKCYGTIFGSLYEY